jgi:hypothetical protein
LTISFPVRFATHDLYSYNHLYLKSVWENKSPNVARALFDFDLVRAYLSHGESLIPMKKRSKSARKQIVYYPPSQETINQYAREVCQQLGQKLHPDYNAPQASRELAGLINLVALIYADHLNKS